LTLHRTLEPAPLVGSDANGEDHQAVIPAGQAVEIHVTGKNVTLNDDKGAPLSVAGAAIPVNQALGAAPGLITIHVHR
jgi:hypothetical protein